jgi:hypothetical protein
MARIDHITEQRIKDAARIMDVLTTDLGVQLRRSGAEWEGLCPFHSDKHIGSFKVSERKNIATCFSCDKTWNPIDALMDGLKMNYHQALRHLAARYGIWIDDEPAPKVAPAAPRQAAPQLPMVWWEPKTMIKPYMGNQELNPLLGYLRSLPWPEEQKCQLEIAINDMYLVGTSTKGETKGWTIWWQIDDQMRVRTGKLMAYKEDGHRDKDRPAPWDPSKTYTFNFVHSMMEKAGKWSRDTHEYHGCLFGLHLVDVFPKAEICLVESEKSALICQSFTDPNKRLWMATGGLSNLKRSKLQPLIDRQRYIVLFPDMDGYEKWEQRMKLIDYPRLSISQTLKREHIPSLDGDHADIADIMLRLVQGIKESPAEIAARRLNATPEQAKMLALLINKLNLKIED